MNRTSDKAWTALWGDLTGVSRRATGTSENTFITFPSAEAPRLVIPTRPHRASGAIFRALRDHSSRRARVTTRMARPALFLGVAGSGRVVLPEPKVVSDVLGLLEPDDYCYGVHLGPPRANRKPVIVLATADGTLVAFLKYAVDDLTDTLVRREAAALGSLGELSSVRVPHLLGSGECAGHPYVLQEPVRPARSRSADTRLVVAAQTEVAGVGASSVDVPEALAACARRWQQRRSSSVLGGPARAFVELAEQWVETMDSIDVPWGSWHGDWRPTNMAVGDQRCSVWDWERFATGVPAGYDALHLFLTTASPTTNDLATLPQSLFDNCERLLAPFGVTGGPAAEAVTRGYLLELAGRYLDDDQAATGSRLGGVDTWLLPFLAGNTPPHSRTASRGE